MDYSSWVKPLVKPALVGGADAVLTPIFIGGDKAGFRLGNMNLTTYICYNINNEGNLNEKNKFLSEFN